MPNFELSRNSVECDRCGEVFTDESTYISHGEADHGDKEEDFEEVADTYDLKMDPNLTESNLRKAKKIIRETNQQELYHSRPFKNPKAKIPTKLEPHISADDLVGGLNGYNDDPNSFFYNNKNFKKGSSTLRTSQLGESVSTYDYFTPEDRDDKDITVCDLCGSKFDEASWGIEDAKNHLRSEHGIDSSFEGFDDDGNYSEKCPDCGRTFDNPADAASHNEETGEIYESRRRAREVGVEICTCGHFGGSTGEGANQHDDRFQQGHGACRVCNCNQFTWTPYGGESETSNYEVDVDEYLETGVAIQKTGGGRSELELNNDERITGEAEGMPEGEDEMFDASKQEITKVGSGAEEADNYPQKAEMTDNEWEKDLKDLKTRYETENEDVDYDELGTVTTQGEEQPVGDIPALERIDFGYEKYESYPTKAVESKKRAKASEVYDGIIDDYDRFVPSDDEDVTEMVTAQKLQGSQSESIAKSLTLRYGVSREDALEKVYSIEVSNNDRVANTFFQKKFSECNKAEIAELRLYCGSDE